MFLLGHDHDRDHNHNHDDHDHDDHGDHCHVDFDRRGSLRLARSPFSNYYLQSGNGWPVVPGFK